MNEGQTTSWVDIVVLNYNGWQDTIECLESVFLSTYQSFRVIVIDNGSGDESVAKLSAWAEGRLKPAPAPNPTIAAIFQSSVPKPISYQILTEEEAKQSSGSEAYRLILIRAEANRGYSAGNNIGIRFSRLTQRADSVWLLNNDTVVRADTLQRLVEHGRQQKGKVGITGAKLLFYHQPDTVQYLGGSSYNPYTGQAQPRGRGLAATDEATSHPATDQSLAFIAGASLFAKRSFIDAVGELNEDYFLYFEEPDWATRGQQRGWTIDYAPSAVVYHKEGASIGASLTSRAYQNKFADYQYHRSRLIYTRKYMGLGPIVVLYGRTLLSLLKSILHGRLDYAALFVRVLLGSGPSYYSNSR